jgi:rubrerythrin
MKSRGLNRPAAYQGRVEKMTLLEALKLALKKEEASIELYKKLLITNKPLEDLLTLLLNEEFKHKKLIEEEIYKATKI